MKLGNRNQPGMNFGLTDSCEGWAKEYIPFGFVQDNLTFQMKRKKGNSLFSCGYHISLLKMGQVFKVIFISVSVSFSCQKRAN